MLPPPPVQTRIIGLSILLKVKRRVQLWLILRVFQSTDCRLQMICIPYNFSSVWHILVEKKPGGDLPWFRKRPICSISSRKSIKFQFVFPSTSLNFRKPTVTTSYSLVAAFEMKCFYPKRICNLGCQGCMFFLMSWALLSLRSFVGPGVLLHMLFNLFTWEMAGAQKMRSQSNRKIDHSPRVSKLWRTDVH